MNDDKNNQLRKRVMSMIDGHGISMRPRWHFILLSALIATGALVLIVALLYIVSLGLFFLRENGVWYAPSFGGRGWFVLLHSAPMLLLVLVAICALLLEMLVRKYSFAYRAPFTISLGGILLLVFVGGFMLAQTSLHRRLEIAAHHGFLPPPIGFWYGKMFRPVPPNDMRRGIVIIRKSGGFVIADPDGTGTSTIEITPQTRLPYGEDFSPGTAVIVIGDADGTDTVRAFGVRTIQFERLQQ